MPKGQLCSVKEVVCVTCEKPFTMKTYQHKYCSKICYHKSLWKKQQRKGWTAKYQWWQKYRLTKAQYLVLKKDQNNSCAICKDEFNGPKEPCVDHCHLTGFIRGILCFRCNILLGMARDNTNILTMANTYLSKAELRKVKGL